MAVNNNLITKAHDNIFCTQTQRMSHYYEVIVCHAYCMDTEYAIEMLLVKSAKNRLVRPPSNLLFTVLTEDICVVISGSSIITHKYIMLRHNIA